MKVGYIRVSKQEQNEALQRDALERVLECADATAEACQRAAASEELTVQTFRDFLSIWTMPTVLRRE